MVRGLSCRSTLGLPYPPISVPFERYIGTRQLPSLCRFAACLPNMLTECLYICRYLMIVRDLIPLEINTWYSILVPSKRYMGTRQLFLCGFALYLPNEVMECTYICGHFITIKGLQHRWTLGLPYQSLPRGTWAKGNFVFMRIFPSTCQMR